MEKRSVRTYDQYTFIFNCKRLHMGRFRGRDITSFRPADVHLDAYFKYTVYLKYASKWTSAGRKDVISLPRNRAMCNRFQVINSLPVCAKHAVNICTSLEQPFLGLSPWHDVMCDTLCMLGEAAVRGLIDCTFILIYIILWTEIAQIYSAVCPKCFNKQSTKDDIDPRPNLLLLSTTYV